MLFHCNIGREKVSPELSACLRFQDMLTFLLLFVIPGHRESSDTGQKDEIDAVRISRQSRKRICDIIYLPQPQFASPFGGKFSVLPLS